MSYEYNKQYEYSAVSDQVEYVRVYWLSYQMVDARALIYTRTPIYCCCPTAAAVTSSSSGDPVGNLTVVPVRYIHCFIRAGPAVKQLFCSHFDILAVSYDVCVDF